MITSEDVRAFAESYAAEKGWKVLDVVCWSSRRGNCVFAHALFYTGNEYKVYIIRPYRGVAIGTLLVASIPRELDIERHACRSPHYAKGPLSCWCINVNGKKQCFDDLLRLIKFLGREGYIHIYTIRTGRKTYGVIASAIHAIAREVKAGECRC